MFSCFSHVRPFVTPWTVARQVPLSMKFSRQEYWSGLPCPPPGDLPDPGIKPTSLMCAALTGGSLPTESPGKPQTKCYEVQICKIGKRWRWGAGEVWQLIFWFLLPALHPLQPPGCAQSPAEGQDSATGLEVSKSRMSLVICWKSLIHSPKYFKRRKAHLSQLPIQLFWKKPEDRDCFPYGLSNINRNFKKNCDMWLFPTDK